MELRFEEYFAGHTGHFWHWDNDPYSSSSGYFEEISMPDGKVIALTPYVLGLLKNLQPVGWPPLDALLMVLIVTNENGKDDYNQLKLIFKRLFHHAEGELHKKLEAAFGLLKLLTNLPPEYHTGKGRELLIQTIFSIGTPWVSSDKATYWLAEFESNKEDLAGFVPIDKPFSSEKTMLGITVLANLRKEFPDVASLMGALGGVPDAVELSEETSKEITEPATKTGQEFIDELIENPSTFPVGNLIPHIWGGLRIPLHHVNPGRQPLGGIADITNKGDFHRLLISEFANDDEVFMSRLANNEALYIQRETPPQPDKSIRVLGVDSTLRSWGAPRVLGFASALAVATHPKTDIVCNIFAVGQDFAPITFGSVGEVIDGMQLLSPKLDSAEGFTKLLSDPVTQGAEVFIVTSEESLAGAEMQKMLAENIDRIGFIITTSGNGTVSFYKIHNKARKLLQRIVLPLDQLWDITKRRPTSKVSSKGKGKQAATQITDHPAMLYPLPAHNLMRFYLNGYIYFLTTKGRLGRTQIMPEHKRVDYSHQNNYYKYPDNYYIDRIRSCEFLLENLSVDKAGIYALDQNEFGEYILFAYYPEKMLFSVLNLNTREYGKCEQSMPVADYVAYAYSGSFYLIDYEKEIMYRHSGTGYVPEMAGVGYDSKIMNAYNESVSQAADLYTLTGSNIVTNLTPVCITGNGELVLSKYVLKARVTADAKSSMRLTADHHTLRMIVATMKPGGNAFEFADGSTVVSDKKGMIVLASSNPDIPTIYVVTSLDCDLAMVAGTDFCGNRLFYNEWDSPATHISIQDFFAKYYYPFINHIRDHEPNH
nr:hypothetical protein [uncultured Flavobacterium sp.]